MLFSNRRNNIIKIIFQTTCSFEWNLEGKKFHLIIKKIYHIFVVIFLAFVHFRHDIRCIVELFLDDQKSFSMFFKNQCFGEVFKEILSISF